MSDAILNMYIVAVDTGRFTIDFVSPIYKQAVADALGIKLNKGE